MRKKELKFHIIAVSSITIIIVLVYIVLGKPQPNGPAVEVIGNRYVQIDSASWGMNCNPYLNDALTIWSKAPDPKPVRPQAATTNNVLSAISSLCNGKLGCTTLVSPQTLGVETVPSCFKRLKVGYRCFEYDRLQTTEVGQGENLLIDCREKKPAPAAPAP